MAFSFICKIFGVFPLMLAGDSAVWDRWIWLCGNIKKEGVRTLDAGCGSGAFTLYSAKKDNDSVGISFDERNNKVARERAKVLRLKNVKFIQGDLRKLGDIKEIGKFDQIICFETIEHIRDDKKLLKDFFSILYPDGVLLLTAPYKFYKHLPGDNISDIEDGGHVRWGYTHEEMKNLLNEVGFEVCKMEYVTGMISQNIIRVERMLSKIFPYRLAWIIVFPFRFLVLFDFLLTKIFRYPYLSIAVVAEKKSL